jgi:hypothetical protein
LPGEARLSLSQIIVRPAPSLGGRDVGFQYDPADARWTDFLNDAETYLANTHHGDWMPPDDWSALGWPPPHDGDGYWSQCSDSFDLLALTLPSAGERKARLLACALARRLRSADEERNVRAIEVAQSYADRRCPKRTMKAACKHSELPWLAEADPTKAVYSAVAALSPGTPSATVCDAVRETFANPFRPVELRREWLRNNGGAAGMLAEVIDSEERYAEMPILADALEDAGCRVAAVLDHCRSGVTHRRGCWVMDLLRGRSEKS